MTDSKIEPKHYCKRKRLFLIGILVLSACSGVITVYLPDNNCIMDYIIGLPCLFLIFAWCHYDALEHGCFMSRSMRICLVIFVFVAFPVYIFKSRGNNGFKALALSLLFVGTSIMISILSGLSSYYLEYLIGKVK